MTWQGGGGAGVGSQVVLCRAAGITHQREKAVVSGYVDRI